jgi:hypothetical protein
MMKWMALTVFVFTWTLTTHGKYSASGDEPHYLMMTQSIVADGDLDLANNYANNDGRLFGHDGLPIGLHAIPSRTGHIRSIHDVGLAVALVPMYVAAQQLARVPDDATLARFRMDRGLLTYSIVSVCLIAVTVAGLALLGTGLSQRIGQPAAAMLVTAIGLSPPILSHSFLVFPEVAGLLVTCVVVWFVLERPSPRDAGTLALIALMVGSLPWTHHKFLVYAPGLLLLVAYERWPLIRDLPRAVQGFVVALFLAPQIVLHSWTWHEWGTLGGALTTGGVPFSLEMFTTGIAGLWVDRESGLLAYAPLFWILPACACLTFRRTWPFFAAVLLIYVPAAAFAIGWWAGFSPAARYLVPIIPLCAVAMADALAFRAVRVAAIALAAPQIAIDLVVWSHPRWLWPAGGTNRALEQLGPLGRAYEALMPPLQHQGLTRSTVWVGVVALTVSVVIVAGARLEHTRTRAPHSMA